MKTVITVSLLACIVGAALADTAVKVYVNGGLRQFTPAAIERDGTAYAPLRAAADAVGASVKWQEKSQKAIICTDRQCTDIAKSDGIIVGGRLLIPLRLMSQALGAKVEWDARANAVRIATR